MNESPPPEHDQLVWMTEHVAKLEARLREVEAERDDAVHGRDLGRLGGLVNRRLLSMGCRHRFRP